MLKKFEVLGTVLTKTEQKSISGAIISPFQCRVFCPSYCRCTGFYNDRCEYIVDGRFCHAL